MPKRLNTPQEDPIDLFEREPALDHEELVPFTPPIEENTDPFEQHEIAPQTLPEGYVRAHQIRMATQTREHIGNLFAENPHLSVYDIGNEFSLWDEDNYHFSDRALIDMIVERTEDSGIVDFLEQMKVRIGEHLTVKKNLETIIERAVKKILENAERDNRRDAAKTASIHKVMSILRSMEMSCTDELRKKAVTLMAEYIEARPDDAQEFLACFGIPFADLEKTAINSYIRRPDVIEKLRSAGIVTVANDSLQMQESALEYVNADVRYGRGEVDMYRDTYRIPDEMLKATIFDALLSNLNVERITPQKFLEELKNYNIVIPSSFNEEQIKEILECFRHRVSSKTDEAIEIRRIFRLTSADIAAIKTDYAERMILASLEKEKDLIDMVRIAKIQETLDVSDDEVRDIARALMEKTWSESSAKGDNIAKKLEAAGLSDQDTERSTLRASIIAGIRDGYLGNIVVQKMKLHPEGPLFDAEESKEIATKRYLRELKDGNLYEIERLEEICDLSAVRGCEGESEAVRKGVLHKLLISSVNIEGAREICEKYSVSELELRTLVEEAALVHLGAGWLQQLKVLRDEFDLEEFLISDRAKVAAAESIRHEMVTYLGFERSDYTHDRNRGGSMPMISDKKVEKVLQCFAISGTNTAAVRDALRDPQLPHLPAFEEGNFPGLEALKHGCPAIGSVFEETDVQTHARELILKNLRIMTCPPHFGTQIFAHTNNRSAKRSHEAKFGIFIG